MTNIVEYAAQKSPVSPHVDFLPVYPIIQRHARVVFRHLPAVEREEAIAEAVATGFASFVHLKERNKNPVELSGAIAKFAVLHVKTGRRMGRAQNSRDVFSSGLGRRVSPRCQFMDEFLADDSVTPVLDQVCFRLDWPAFVSSLSPRNRQIVRALARGHSAKWVAGKFNLSQPRITQLRQQWRREWLAFIGESECADDARVTHSRQMA